MTKIRQDKHSLYIKTDGGIFRPVESRGSYTSRQPYDTPEGKPIWAADPTLFAVGESVKARHINQTPFALLVHEDGRKAKWYCHGMYFHKTSEDCWII